ncbi:ABC transporter substrate-binding protein [Pusillimonas sp.]|uniref:ABC transporter substrate-binding protein n=1 Tax=Pusillimonas sp. TaxID=3040095 RepID=UPI0037CAA8B3
MKARAKLLLAVTALCSLLGTAAAQAKETVTYAYQMDPMYEAALWAMKNGKVTSDKIEVKMTALSIPALIQATTTKQYDAIQADVINVQRSADRGLPLVILSTANRYNAKGEGHNIWVKKDSPYQTMQDLKGKKIAVPSLGSSGFNLLRFATEERHNVNMNPLGGDFVFVEMPVPQIEAALAAGQVDAATTILSQNYRVAKSGDYRPVATPARDMYELWNLRMIPSINVSYPEKIKERPEAMKELGRMMAESAAYLRANPDEVYGAVAEEQNIDPDFFKALSAGYAESPNVLTDDDRKAIIKLWDLAHKRGVLKQEPDNEKYFWADAVTTE